MSARANVGLSRLESVLLLEAAALAPSLHNSQPWRLEVSHRQVRLYADLARQLQVVDPAGRQLVISCGCALFNLRVAASALGLAERVCVAPNPEDPALLATVDLGLRGSGRVRTEPLYDAIPMRRTNRFPFEDCDLSDAERSDLTTAARDEGCELLMVSEPDEQRRIGDLVRLADEEQDQHPDLTAERASWTAVEAGREDGVPGYALGPLAADAESIVRDLRRGAPVPGRPSRTYEEAAVFGILVSPADDLLSWVSAGQALERVLLTATVRGLAVSFVNQPLEVPRLRAQVLPASCAAGEPQMLLRVGRGLPVPPTPRRVVG